MPKHYFSLVTQDYWTSQNKLQAEAKQVAHEIELQVIHKDQLTSFLVDLHDRIDVINAKYPRCKPLHIESLPHETSDRIFGTYYIPLVFVMVIYKVKEG